MNEEHQEDVVNEEVTPAPRRSKATWFAFIAAMMVISGVATSTALANSDRSSGCMITDAKVAITSFLGMNSEVVHAATTTGDAKGCLLYTSPSPRD